MNLKHHNKVRDKRGLPYIVLLISRDIVNWNAEEYWDKDSMVEILEEYNSEGEVVISDPEELANQILSYRGKKTMAKHSEEVLTRALNRGMIALK